MNQSVVSHEVQLFILFVAVLILPKMLLRFRIPSGITALLIGVVTSLTLNWFKGDPTVSILATLGITSLFLFAGLEVEFKELRRHRKFMAKHLMGGVVVLCLIALVLERFLGISFRASLLLALALRTPSTGFILDSIKAYGFSRDREQWVRSQAIAMEIVALIILFLVLQSNTWSELIISSFSLAAIIFILPVLFRYFLKVIAPFAPDSEFTFLVLIALLAGVLTRTMGAYYLVGAFIVGVTARRFGPILFSENIERVLYSLRVFFSFFIPFYFFRAGSNITLEDLSWMGLVAGGLFCLIFLPMRMGSMVFIMRYFDEECWEDRVPISMSLLPTLVFGLVVAGILRNQFDFPPHLFTGLVVYTVVSSILPSFFLKKAPPVDFGPSFRQVTVKRGD